MDKDGLNVAFCEGNGILVFLDLVTFIAGKLMNFVDEDNEAVKENFRLILFVQFESWEKSIAMSYLDRVNELAKKIDSQIIELVLTVNSIDNK